MEVHLDIMYDSEQAVSNEKIVLKQSVNGEIVYFRHSQNDVMYAIRKADLSRALEALG